MKIVEMREKNIDELLVIADDLKAQIHGDRIDISMNKSNSNGSIRNAKRDLARAMTVISEKQSSK